MNFRLFPTLIAWLAVLLLLNSCGSSAPLERDHFYALRSDIILPPTHIANAIPVQLGNFTATGFIAGRQILYREAPNDLETQRYEQLLWETPPHASLPDLIGKHLRLHNNRIVLLPAETSATTVYALNGQITRFEHQPLPTPGQVEIAFDLELIHKAQRNLVWKQHYVGTELVQGNTPEDMMQAFNRLATRLADQASLDLVSRIK